MTLLSKTITTPHVAELLKQTESFIAELWKKEMVSSSVLQEVDSPQNYFYSFWTTEMSFMCLLHPLHKAPDTVYHAATGFRTGDEFTVN